MSDHTVLVVNTDEHLLRGVAGLLEGRGLSVAACAGFDTARRYIETHVPDIVVTDVRLGAFNGLHLVLLAKQRNPDVMAYVYSRHTDEATRLEAAALGAQYIDERQLLADVIPEQREPVHVGRQGRLLSS